MEQVTLPPVDEMWAAFSRRDPEYDGIFVTGVATTGIFCRPTCSAKKPRRDNVEFFPGARDALTAGYRPCKRCRPMENGVAPEWIAGLLDAVEADPSRRWKDQDLRERGLEPERVRRWFQRHHGMTFQAWQRGLRLGGALAAMGNGGDIAAAGYEAGYESLSGFYDAVKRWTGKSPGRSRDASVIRLTRIGTPMGPMVAGATERALAILEFADRRMLETQLERLAKRTGAVFAAGRNEVLERAEVELAEYFAGERREFELPLETKGTEFQERVWTVLREIPYGETRSYAEMAELAGSPRAFRAAGSALGANPIPIVVPCHRVLRSGGGLGGYGGGLPAKRLLLELEHAVSRAA
jgi:AraC family transcriptional regulator of adaptative response/methylated-DNA-[protein]-cysteine methyltransferase